MSLSTPSRATSLAQLGGGLGITACCIGLAVFFGACCGFNAVFMLSIIPLILSSIGIVLSVLGPVLQKSHHLEDGGVFAGIFLNLLGIIGSLLLMSAWLHWQVFGK
jgi:hypothetical protein